MTYPTFVTTFTIMLDIYYHVNYIIWYTHYTQKLFNENNSDGRIHKL